MYPWHGTTASNHHQTPSTASRPQVDTTSSSSSSQSSFQMPHLRWLPSMISRSQNTLPNISSNLRMGQDSHHQPVSVVIETRLPPPPESEISDSDQSESAMRVAAGTNGLGDSDYAPSPSELAQGASQNASSGPIGGGGPMTSSAGSGSVARRSIGEGDLDDARGDTPRTHGKRLTTLEEVSLFDICNRHAREFGQRSNLCKWWMTVTDEFTRDQGHPYSWYSVRRKVEIVTKQRMKFLEEMREKGTESEDLSNPRWRAAVDAWIPTWQRWEEAEAQRIEKRDSRITRKRKKLSLDVWEANSMNRWRPPPPSTPVQRQLPPQHSPTPTPNPPAPAPASASALPPAPHPPQNAVRLPPGFDSMFSQQAQANSPSPGYPYQHSLPYQQTPPIGPSSAIESNMMTAVLDTLGKLNKHLDSVNTDHRASPVISSLVSNTPQPEHRPRPSQEDIGLPHITNDNPTTDEHSTLISSTLLNKLKDEVRREVHEELRREIEKDRALLEEKLDSVQRTQEMILEMLRQEPA